MEGQRRDAAAAILTKFGASIEKAEQNAATKTSDPVQRKAMAARAALEYAVLATAREKNVPTELVANTLKNATVAQQTLMLKEGTAAMGRTYRIEPEVLANAFAGRITEVAMPKGLGSTPEIDKMVDSCRTLVTSIIKDEYAQRGRLEGLVGKTDSFLALQSEGKVAPVKTELAARLAFMEATIDSAVTKGSINADNAAMLKDRIEAQVFQPRPPQSLQFSKEFNAYFEHRGKALRIDVMKDVRGVTQSNTVKEISEKLKLVMPEARQQAMPADHRAHKPMER